MKECRLLNDTWQVKDFFSPDGALSPAQAQRVLGEADGWFSAQMPATAHEILFEAGVLPKEILETGRTQEACWVSDRDWAYRHRFTYAHSGVERRVRLEFDGLDAVADVFLNGKHILRHESMYLRSSADITGVVAAENELLLYFHCPKKMIGLLEKKLPARYEGKVNAAALLRKTHGDFNSHGGALPYLTPVGVYGDIRLVTADECEIESLDVDVTLNQDLSRAEITVRMRCSRAEGITARVELRDPDGKAAADVSGDAWEADGDGGMTRTFTLAVDGPRLWWPRNYGEQPLYTLVAALSRDGRALETREMRLGIRKVEVAGDMQFTVNGKRVRLWGTCIVPMWGPSHRWQSERGLLLMDYAAKAHMNAIRLWGPGQPYHDELYEEADRLGILIWQEFHTWGTHMPDLPEYRQAVLREAEAMIRRLKHHACVFMWCGGNEQIYMADLFDPGAKQRIGHDILHHDLKDLVARMDPRRYYHVSSPSGGAYANEAVFGDTHGSRASRSFLPGEEYARFFSEDIRTCVPELKSLKRFIPQQDLWPEDYADTTPHGVTAPLPPAWMERTINHMEDKAGAYELFHDAVDPASLIYKINAAAVYDNRHVIHRMRRGKPFYRAAGERHGSGYLIWKLDTSWPQIYCALIDYYMEPGQTYYGVKRAYAPVLVSIDVNEHVCLWGVNDTLEDFTGRLTVTIYDLEARREIFARVYPAGIPAGDSLIVKNLTDIGQFLRACVLHASLADMRGNCVSEDFQLMKPERRLTFPDASLTLEKTGERTLRVTSDDFARCVELTGDCGGDAFGWHFSDNYFDLMPGQSRVIKWHGKHSHGTLWAKAQFSANAAKLTV